MLLAATAVVLGAALGALLRWGLSSALNHLWPQVPAGTLMANLLGGYGIGLALALLAASPSIGPEWRLFIITGFFGGLTTFSTFSAEVIEALQRGSVGWAAATVAAHVLGSLVFTSLGLATPSLLRNLQA